MEMNIPRNQAGRSEIDEVLIKLHRLLTEMKSAVLTEMRSSHEGEELKELKRQIQNLFARANSLIEQIDDPDEMERVHKNAAGVAGMASYLFNEKDSEVRGFLQLLGICENEQT